VIAGPCHKKKHPPQLLPDHRLTIVSRDEKRVLGVILKKGKRNSILFFSSIVPSATVTIRRHSRQMRPNRIEHLDNKKRERRRRRRPVRQNNSRS